MQMANIESEKGKKVKKRKEKRIEQREESTGSLEGT